MMRLEDTVNMSLFASTTILLLVTTGVFGYTHDDTTIIEAELDEYRAGLEKFVQYLDKLNQTGIFQNRVKDTFLIPLDKIQNLNESLVKLKEIVADHHNMVSELSNKVTGFEKTVSETVSRQEQQIIKLEPQLAVLEKRVQNQSSELTQLQNDLNNLGKRVDGRGKDIKDYDQKYTSLEESFQNQENNYVNLEVQLSQFKDDFTNVKDCTELFQGFVEGFNDEHGKLLQQVADLENEVQQLKNSGPKVAVKGTKTKTGGGSSRLCDRGFKKN